MHKYEGIMQAHTEDHCANNLLEDQMQEWNKQVARERAELIEAWEQLDQRVREVETREQRVATMISRVEKASDALDSAMNRLTHHKLQDTASAEKFRNNIENSFTSCCCNGHLDTVVAESHTKQDATNKSKKHDDTLMKTNTRDDTLTNKNTRDDTLLSNSLRHNRDLKHLQRSDVITAQDNQHCITPCMPALSVDTEMALRSGRRRSWDRESNDAQHHILYHGSVMLCEFLGTSRAGSHSTCEIPWEKAIWVPRYVAIHINLGVGVYINEHSFYVSCGEWTAIERIESMQHSATQNQRNCLVVLLKRDQTTHVYLVLKFDQQQNMLRFQRSFSTIMAIQSDIESVYDRARRKSLGDDVQDTSSIWEQKNQITL